MCVGFISCINLPLICFPSNLLFSTPLDFSYFSSRAMEKTVGVKKRRDHCGFQALVLDSVQLNENSVQITE